MLEKLVLPKRDSVIGSVVAMQPLLIDGRDVIVVTVQDVTGMNNDLWFNTKFVENSNLHNVLFVGNVISVTVEICIADVTSYLNEDGDYDLHERDHLRAINAANASDMLMLLKNLPQSFIDAVEARRKGRSTERPLRVVNPRTEYSNGQDIRDAIETLTNKIAYTTDEGIRKQLEVRLEKLELMLKDIAGE